MDESLRELLGTWEEDCGSCDGGPRPASPFPNTEEACGGGGAANLLPGRAALLNEAPEYCLGPRPLAVEDAEVRGTAPEAGMVEPSGGTIPDTTTV